MGLSSCLDPAKVGIVDADEADTDIDGVVVDLDAISAMGKREAGGGVKPRGARSRET